MMCAGYISAEEKQLPGLYLSGGVQTAAGAEYDGKELPYSLQTQLKYQYLNHSGGSYTANDAVFGRLYVSYDTAAQSLNSILNSSIGSRVVFSRVADIVLKGQTYYFAVVAIR